MEGKLLSALKEIKKLRKKNKKKKELLVNYEKEKDKYEYSSFFLLKVELEEAKKIEDTLLEELKENGKECERLVEEIVFIIKELENTWA